jgi:hypothetical protein
MRSGALTANELLALLGRAWPRLLIYPGGLAAFALVWLIGRTKNQEPRTKNNPTNPGLSLDEGDERRKDTIDRTPTNYEREPWSVVGSPLDMSAVVLPWLGLALLPLPGAAGISRQTDLITVLALLEWPLLLAIVAELRESDAAWPRRLAAALNSYPPLILATLVLTSTGGSFDMTALARPPDADTPLSAALVHWIGAIAWLLALPPALAIGAFAAGMPDQRTLRTGLRLRTVGLVAIAALPWFPLVGGANMAPGGPSANGPAWLWLPLAPLLIVALLWGYSRLTARHSARRWARAYLAFDAALLLVLLWAAYTALQARLV